MKKIIYHFADGTHNEVEVTDEFYAMYQTMEKEERNRNRAETRRHVSLSQMQENGFEPEMQELNPEEILLKDEQLDILKRAMETLTKEQKDLIKKVYFQNKNISTIADEEGVSVPAIFYRLEKIYKKIRKNFI